MFVLYACEVASLGINIVKILKLIAVLFILNLLYRISFRVVWETRE